MSIIELIPLDKGNRLILDDTVVTTIGRTPNIGCLDKRISRNHAELFIKSDGSLWIKPIHHNPTFYKTKTDQLVTLTKDQEFQLNDDDQIGLLPNEYFYRISIKSKGNEEQPSAVPKSPIEETEQSSPIQDEESSPVRDEEPAPIENQQEEEEEEEEKEKSPPRDPRLEPEGGVILHTTRALPSWMSTSSIPEPKTPKGRGKGKTTTPTKPTPSPSKYRTYIGRKKAEGIVYDDDDEEESNEEPVTTSAKQNTQTASKVIDPNKRERCPYGKFCYRKNPAHRKEAIHPGDPDWDNKENDNNDTKPECPYGSDCYRKNPEHFNEYSHTKKPSSINKKGRTSKRKGSDDEDDDDGLPNEYDYNDSFIDDEELDDSVRIDRTASSQRDPDGDWRPHKKARHSDNIEEEDNFTDESELNLLKEEAADFVQGSSPTRERPAKKKARIHIPNDDDDD